MSGHNKWSTIKHRKGAQDAKRSKIFSRIAKAIAVAVQNGGPDPETNSALKLAMDQGRKANMPKDNIERAMKRGSGDESARIEEVTYEAMGPGGSAMMIMCATDNTNRTLTDVKTALKKNGGKFVPSGSVGFQFDFVGYISTTPTDIEAAELEAIEYGAEDVIVEDKNLIIITKTHDLHAVLKNIDTDTVNEARLVYNPTQPVTLSDQDKKAYTVLYEIIEDLDDVVEIFDNVA
ncbi:MAG: YebC/PmpR family DNA-binding transcriptional regulator [Candidatus Moraniibacteriota bacterium]|nr:MAG: YebC/PmpR family DNA-binding transcriptional regulator [Candidatus Moranbacteria bacterium]